MTRTQIIGLLGALAGGTSAAVALVLHVLSGGAHGILSIDCVPNGNECVLSATPSTEQCTSLLANGGDSPQAPECDAASTDPTGTACRMLYELSQARAIGAWHTSPLLLAPVDGGAPVLACTIDVRLTRDQANAWREALTGRSADDAGVPLPDVTDAPGILGAGGTLAGTHATEVRHGWSGGSSPDIRTEHFDLGLKDAGP